MITKIEYVLEDNYENYKLRIIKFLHLTSVTVGNKCILMEERMV